MLTRDDRIFMELAERDMDRRLIEIEIETAEGAVFATIAGEEFLLTQWEAESASDEVEEWEPAEFDPQSVLARWTMPGYLDRGEWELCDSADYARLSLCEEQGYCLRYKVYLYSHCGMTCPIAEADTLRDAKAALANYLRPLAAAGFHLSREGVGGMQADGTYVALSTEATEPDNSAMVPDDAGFYQIRAEVS